MIEAILAAIVAIFKAIPYFDRWFTKSAAKKEEDAKKEIRDAIENARKTGRPRWD